MEILKKSYNYTFFTKIKFHIDQSGFEVFQIFEATEKLSYN